MNPTQPRRLLAVALLSASLTGCGYFQIASSSGAQPTPIVELIPAPTAAALPAPAPTEAPTTAPAPTATALPAPAPAQGQGKLPGLGDPAWYELARADFDGDGAEERALSLFSQQVEPRQGFADEYMARNAMMADVLVIAEADDTIALQLDLTGLRAGGAELRAFPAEAAPASFAVALDPGGPYPLAVLPLGANGLQAGELFLVAFEQGAYTVVETPQEALVTRPAGEGLTAEEADPQTQLEVGQWAIRYLAEVAPGTPAVVGAVARAGDYAAAQASLFGEPRPRMIYLRDDADGWSVLLDTTQAGASALESAGVPLALADYTPRLDVLAAAANHLQDPRGAGMDGVLVIEALADSFARLSFVPTDRERYDTPTLFFAGTQSGWQFVTAGTAFRPEDYTALGIPESVR